jgi:hypothetical protein
MAITEQQSYTKKATSLPFNNAQTRKNIRLITTKAPEKLA